MEIGAKEARIAALNEEMDRIHFVNGLYWQRGEAVTSEEDRGSVIGRSSAPDDWANDRANEWINKRTATRKQALCIANLIKTVLFPPMSTEHFISEDSWRKQAWVLKKSNLSCTRIVIGVLTQRIIFCLSELSGDEFGERLFQLL
jgi:hypothetical protein